MIDFEKNNPMGYCLHYKHTMKLSYRIYKNRHCSECRHFFPITANAQGVKKDLTQENGLVDIFIDNENKTP